MATCNMGSSVPKEISLTLLESEENRVIEEGEGDGSINETNSYPFAAMPL